ncbi:MAG: glycosyltransferase [Promethearchaeota archaeon]
MQRKLEKILYIGFFDEKVTRSVKFIDLLINKNVKIIKFKFSREERFLFLKRLKKIFNTILKEKIDAIIYFSDFFSPLIFFIKLLSKIKHVPFVNKFDISGLYYKLDRNCNKISYFQYLKSFIFDKVELTLADAIVFLTNAQLNHFQKRFNIHKKKCFSLYLGTNESIFYPRKKKKSMESPIIVGYWGSYIPLHGVKYIIEAARLLKNDKNIKFLMLGKGPTFNYAVNQKERYSLENIDILGFLPFNEFIENISKIDISLGIFGNSEKANWCITNKVYEAIAMGFPVITRISSATRELFENKENVILCKPADPKSLSQAIIKLASNKNLREKVGLNAQILFSKKCSDSKLGNDLYFLIERLIYRNNTR